MKKFYPLALLCFLCLAGCGEAEPMMQESPPELTVTCDTQSVTALKGTFSWFYTREDGTGSAIEADSIHPLACKDLMTRVETGETAAKLTFPVPPDSIQAQCWSEDPAQWNIRCLTEGIDPMYAAIPEEAPVTGSALELKPGAYIYQVTARWDMEGRDWGGNCRYIFWIDRG